MNLITQITWEHIKKNRRTSLAVMVAVLLSATLLCSICIFVYAFWSASAGMARYNGGDWHGELYESTPGEKLTYIEGNPKVDAVMIKGAWQAVQLPEGSAMPYLFLRDTNEAYWQDMSEQHTLLEGRLPEKSGEIAVSKLFFDRNPEYQIGDTLMLPTGQRMLDGEELSLQSIRMEGETFRQTGELTLTIVGKLDLTTTTAYPGYYAMGYLEREEIAPDAMLTIYLRFTNMRETYEVLPEIAESIGFRKDEFGEYALRYNTVLLGLYGISDGSEILSFQRLAIYLSVALVLLLMVATFALIIGSVFSLSANARITQLGVLRSVGAEPGQIKASILLEGLILSTLPLALAVLLGYAFSRTMGRIYSDIMADMLRYELDFRFSPIVAIVGVLISLASVLIAVRFTARKMTKLTPIEAVRGIETQNPKKRKEKKHRLAGRVFGYPGILALDNLAAYRKAFRMPVAALCISFVLVGGTLCLIGIAMESNEANYSEDYYDATTILYLSQERDEALIEELQSLKGVQESVVNSSIRFGMPVTADMESEEFTQTGGFASVDTNRYSVVARDEGWRIQGTLVGLNDAAFTRYCEGLGIEAQKYLSSETPKAIVVNSVHLNPNARTEEERHQTIPFLKLKVGDIYTFNEQATDDIKSSHTFHTEIGAVTQEYPVLDIDFSNYQILLVVPMAQYDSIVSDFLPERASFYRRTDVKIRTDVDDLIVEAALEEICSSYLGSEDYLVYSREGELESQRTGNTGIFAVASGVALLFALIGITNAFSSVTGNLAMRRKDFAMLRSVGLDEKGFGRVLFIEGLFFAMRPILLAIPWIVCICALLVYMLDMPLSMLGDAIPLGAILAYASVILAVMGSAYLFGARKIRKGNIIEALRSGLV